MNDPRLGFLAAHHQGVLATISSDGRPQLSNIVYLCRGDLVRISVTASRAKTRNLERDPRLALHVTTPEFRPYVVAEGRATLGPVSRRPGDAAGVELAEVYRLIRGEHPDWDEFHRAMVDEGRLVLRFRVDRLYGTA